MPESSKHTLQIFSQDSRPNLVVGLSTITNRSPRLRSLTLMMGSMFLCVESFMECVTFHLLTVFRNDAAEAQRYYISNCLKKPNRVPIRQFVQRVQQLNDYLELLPCLFQSNRATPATKKVGPIDDADLAGHILRMCPGTWQAQYELKAETVPQCVRDLNMTIQALSLKNHSQVSRENRATGFLQWYRRKESTKQQADK